MENLKYKKGYVIMAIVTLVAIIAAIYATVMSHKHEEQSIYHKAQIDYHKALASSAFAKGQLHILTSTTLATSKASDSVLPSQSISSKILIVQQKPEQHYRLWS